MDAVTVHDFFCNRQYKYAVKNVLNVMVNECMSVPHPKQMEGGELEERRGNGEVGELLEVDWGEAKRAKGWAVGGWVVVEVMGGVVAAKVDRVVEAREREGGRE